MADDYSSLDPATKDDRLQLAIDRFKLAVDAEKEQREDELHDLEFIDEDKQWPQDIYDNRQGGAVPGTDIVVPPQPCLVINLIKQPIQQVQNQQRAARFQLQFSPKGEGASRETAEVFEDIARAVQVDSRAHLARNWAFERAAKCGRGAYRIVTEYANDGDDDLDIVYKRILNQAAVYFDPFAQEPDWSDGEWCFIAQDIPWHRFKREYPESKLSKAGEDDLRGIGDDYPDWIRTSEDAGKTIRVAEYFYVEHADEPLPGTRREKAKKRVVKWCKLTCVEFLEVPRDFDIPFIPVIPVIWEESNVNGRRSWKGIVRPAKDAQRSYNYMRSKQVQAIGLTPLAPFIMAEGQDDGYEKMWQAANTRAFPALKYRPVSLSGQPMPPPQRDIAEPAIQAVTLAAHEAQADVQSTTGFHPPALGDNPKDQSGKALLLQQKQAEMGSSGGIDNLASMSMTYEGKVLKAWIPIVYDRPGRIVAVIGADDERKSIIVGQPFTMKEGEPQPMQAPQGVDPVQFAKQMGGKYHDLSKGAYTVAVTTGKAFTTRREEATAMMGELAQAMPQTLPAWADIWVKNMDGPGFLQIADRLKKGVPPQFLDQGDGMTPEVQLMQAQQKLQQLGQLFDLTTKELEAKTKLIETDAVKANQDLTRSKMELESKERIEYAKIQADIEIEQLKAGNQAALAQMQAQISYLIAEQGAQAKMQQQSAAQAHQAAMAGAQATVDGQEAQLGREHEGAMAGAQMGHEAEMTSQQQAFDAEQAAQQPTGAA